MHDIMRNLCTLTDCDMPVSVASNPFFNLGGDAISRNLPYLGHKLVCILSEMDEQYFYWCTETYFEATNYLFLFKIQQAKAKMHAYYSCLETRYKETKNAQPPKIRQNIPKNIQRKGMNREGEEMKQHSIGEIEKENTAEIPS